VVAYMVYTRFDMGNVEFAVCVAALLAALLYPAFGARVFEGFDDIQSIVNDEIIGPFDDLIKTYYKNDADAPKSFKEVAMDKTRYGKDELATIDLYDYKMAGIFFCKLRYVDPEKYDALMSAFGIADKIVYEDTSMDPEPQK
jgi:hypothetical protein